MISYSVRIDSADLSTLAVEMRVLSTADTFRIAMATHPENDDRFWRYIEGLHVDTDRGTGLVMRLDSALWLIRAPGRSALIRYRIRFPAPGGGRRAAWRPFLSPQGGLIGGLQTFLYVVGREALPFRVALRMPAGWEASTGLEPTDGPMTYTAPDAAVLLDSPFLLGHTRTWRFDVDGVPHRISYLPDTGSVPFDTASLIAGAARLARETERVFGRFPYHAYTFLLQDGAFGALEHLNSLTLGFSSAGYAHDPRSFFATLAHEYFHTWNLLRLRPAGFGEVSYGPPPASRSLWWSEGVTMMYADKLLRRAGLPVYTETRRKHLEELIVRYAEEKGNSLFSPENVSFSVNGGPGALGDYSASTHLQGELLGTMLDFIIRDATGGTRSLDDLLREMFTRFSGKRGFTGGDIEKAASAVCGYDMHAFFESYVRAPGTIDFNRYLGLIGLRMGLSWTVARDSTGTLEPDVRIYAWQAPDDSLPSIGITDPETCWGKAGIHTGDVITDVNGRPPGSAADFRRVVRSLRTGDTLTIGARHQRDPIHAVVVITGYDRPAVRIEEIKGASEKQLALRLLWESGAP